MVSDHLGTPLELHDGAGRTVWGAQLDSYGQARQGVGKASDCPFRYQGQYEDAETGLYYNRFRYYSPQEGMYISQDPIGLAGGRLDIYSYVDKPNLWTDALGLVGGGSYRRVRDTSTGGEVHHMPANSVNGLPHGDGPAIHMNTADHRRTASWGRRTTSQDWRTAQQELINRGKFGKAMEMDIRDIQRKFGNAHNANMRSAVDHAINQAYITRAEGNRLKRRHLRPC